MKYKLNQIPLFTELEESKNILLCGAGGGFDIFSGIPLYYNLRSQGKNVVLGNFSFTSLNETTSNNIFPYCYEIKIDDRDLSGRNYFPEQILKSWFESKNENVDIYAFERIGVKYLKKVYDFLIEKHNIDTIVLVDGGTDSLMFGDEEGLGTPQEDICSMAAVYQTNISKQFLVCIGFGIDHYHGVSHYHFLENITKIDKIGGYLGLFQLNKNVKETQLFLEAIEFANKRMIGKESIVANSIASAIEGEYGDHHRTRRTKGSKLWINPLMTIYWSFNLKIVVPQIKYYEFIKGVSTIGEFNKELANYRNRLDNLREKKQIPI